MTLEAIKLTFVVISWSDHMTLEAIKLTFVVINMAVCFPLAALAVAGGSK